MRLNFSGKGITDAREFLVFLGRLHTNHPHLECLSVWPHCITNTTSVDVVPIVCGLGQNLVRLDLALPGLASSTLMDALANLSLPTVRDLRLQQGRFFMGPPKMHPGIWLSYTHLYDMRHVPRGCFPSQRNPSLCLVQPALPCPQGLQCLETLHLMLGHRVTHGGLCHWQACGLNRLRELFISFVDLTDNAMLWEIAALVRPNVRSLRKLSLHNVSMNPSCCDPIQLVQCLDLEKCENLRILELLQPLHPIQGSAFLCILPSSIHKLDIQFPDVTHSGSAPILYVPPVKSLCIWLPRVCNQALDFLGWLGCLPTEWHVDTIQRRATRRNADWKVLEWSVN